MLLHYSYFVPTLLLPNSFKFATSIWLEHNIAYWMVIKFSREFFCQQVGQMKRLRISVENSLENLLALLRNPVIWCLFSRRKVGVKQEYSRGICSSNILFILLKISKLYSFLQGKNEILYFITQNQPPIQLQIHPQNERQLLPPPRALINPSV